MSRSTGRAIAALVLVAGCASKPPPPPVGISTKAGTSVDPQATPSFSFDSLDDRPVSSAALQGKPAVIALVTTGDIVGQAQVGFLVAMAKRDGADVSYALVALHPRREAILVEAYKSTLGVQFPVALAESSTTVAATGPFGEISAVPTVVILDRQGRIVWKHTGLAKSDELRAHMRGL